MLINWTFKLCTSWHWPCNFVIKWWPLICHTSSLCIVFLFTLFLCWSIYVEILTKHGRRSRLLSLSNSFTLWQAVVDPTAATRMGCTTCIKVGKPSCMCHVQQRVATIACISVSTLNPVPPLFCLPYGDMLILAVICVQQLLCQQQVQVSDLLFLNGLHESNNENQRSNAKPKQWAERSQKKKVEQG